MFGRAGAPFRVDARVSAGRGVGWVALGNFGVRCYRSSTITGVVDREQQGVITSLLARSAGVR
jgi:hypothetical protein